LREHSLVQLERVGLADKANSPAADLAFGQMKLLEMARALAQQPKLLLLDEFAAGLTHREAEHMAGIIRSVRAEGVTVLLVEHDMPLVMSLSDTVIVMNFGEKISEGVPEAIQNAARVIEVYLGSGI
jgi:ABC-type branched-subunit amino acid transport system ATPase component